MSTSSRIQTKAMLDSWRAFDTAIKLSTQALAANKVKKYKNLSQLVHENFFKYDKDYWNYKADTIEKSAKSEETFNGVSIDEQTGEEVPNYPYNDSWSDNQMTRYSDMMEKLEDAIEENQTNLDTIEQKPQENIDLLVSVAKSEFSAIETSVKKLDDEIKLLADSSITFVCKSVYDNKIELLTHRLTSGLLEKVNSVVNCDTEASKAEDSKVNFLTKFEVFVSTQQAVLESCSNLLISKVKKDDPVPIVSSSVEPKLRGPEFPREQVFLEKSKPPKFNGEDIDFPEFKRKWTAIVTKANLPVETELDKLRDNIPRDAKEQLYGVKSLDEAWKILSSRYGDPMLIGRKLKAQLKGVQPAGKNDPEKVISLKIKVRNIVTRLEALSMGEALKHDQEFLSAVYNALPDRHRKGWWDFPKPADTNLWDCMLLFLEKIYEQSNGELAMLPVFTKIDNAKPIKSAGLSAGQVGNSVNNDDAMLKAKEACGLCPVCSKNHTFKKRDGTLWPTDRLFKCSKFQDMNVQQRAAAVQKAGGCARCTSWKHQRKDCLMKANSCGENVSGSKCGGDHSKLIHGSGNVYCGVARSETLQISQSFSNDVQSSSDPFSIVDESEVAVYFLQDIPLKNSTTFARTLWDKGSNRVLVREQFAFENNLVSRDVTYRMEVVAGEEAQIVNSKLYLIELKDMYGNNHTIWGYGVPRIMLSDVPDLSGMRPYFPHIPAIAFQSLPTKEVDILIGLNMMELQPSGGLGVDRVGGMSALRSIFGSGWVLGGHHHSIQSNSCLSSAAVSLKVAKIQIRPEPSHTPEFWEAEGMGVLPPPRCDSCKSCMKSGLCSERHYEHGL